MNRLDCVFSTEKQAQNYKREIEKGELSAIIKRLPNKDKSFYPRKWNYQVIVKE